MRFVIAAIAVLLSIALAQTRADEGLRVDVAEFDAEGNLVVPTDFDRWIFIGSSLGQQYSDEAFNPSSPGMFQVVRMEPAAYQAFLDTGVFADGSLFALHFYGAQEKVSINRSGFVMDDLHFAEIHYKDSKYPQGFNFFTFRPGDVTASEVALPNDCVECHRRDAAYDGVFVQFYPDIWPHLPADVQAWLQQDE